MTRGASERAAVTDLRLLAPALAGWAGVLLLLPRPASEQLAGALAGGAAAAAGAWGARTGRRHGTTLTLAGLAVTLLLVAAAGHGAVREAGPIPGWAEQRAVVRVEGTVLGDPKLLPVTEERPQPRVLLRLRVESAVGRGHRADVRTPVLLIGDTRLLDVHWHERVRARGRLIRADPGEDVTAILRLVGPIESLAPAGPAAAAAEHVRSRLRESANVLPADARGLVPALVIGDRSLTPPELADDMLATGMSHLTAVSGTNVTLVLAGTLLAGQALGLPRRWRPTAGALALAGFVVLARPDPSVLRASAMGAVGLLGVSWSRRGAGLPALACAVLVLLLWDPWLARSYGFALSTLATLGLLLFARPWGSAIAACLPPRLRVLADATAIPLAAQAVCAPVVVLLQGSVSVVAVLANLLAAPLVAPTTIVGVATALLAAVWPGPATLTVWGAGIPALGIAVVARTLAAVPFGTAPWPDGVGGALLLAALTIVVLLTAPRAWWAARRRPGRAAAVAVLVLACAWAILWPARPGAWTQAPWRFAACDVGQGDALVVRTGPARAVVVDAGPDPDLVDACLDRLGVAEVDALVLTHYHADHVGGVDGVTDGRPVRSLVVGALADPPEQAERVRQWAARAGLTPRVVGGGTELAWGEVSARVRGPARLIDAGSLPNNASLVLDVTAPELRVLLLGDIEREAARAVRTDLRAHPGAGRGIDVLKVAHHGSANRDPALYTQLGAPVAVISVGADNDHGHPAPAVLTELAQAGMAVYRTDRDGDVLLGSQDGRLVVGRG